MLHCLTLAIALTVPTSLESFRAAHPTQLSDGNYEAAQETTRRKSITVNLKSEDRVLGTSDRAKLISAARDLRRGKASPEEDESIVSRLVPLSRALDWVLSGKVQDGKAIASVLWAAQKYHLCGNGKVSKRR